MQIYQTKKEKILKVIQIVYDILSALFIVFIGVSLIIGSNKGEKGSTEQLTPTIQTPIRKNATITDKGNIYTFGSDIGSGTFLKGFLTYMSNNFGEEINDFAYSQNGYMSFSGENLGYITDISGIRPDNPSLSSNKGYVIGFSLTATRTGEGSLGNGLSFRGYTAYLLPVVSNDFVTSNVAIQYQLIFYLNSSNDVISYEFDVIKRTNDFSYYFVYDSTITNDIIIKLMSGGQSGYDYAYKQGYDKGYIEGSNGVATNAFTTISQAFTAIANIFNVQVLPNLPLWVLVFAPLIIAVVIVVVKMIKG